MKNKETDLLKSDVKFISNLTVFKHIMGNRTNEVLDFESRVHKLMTLLKKDGQQLNPIQVDTKMRVVDGQTRIEALRRLYSEGWTPITGKQGVDFIVVPERNVSQIRSMNGVKTDWTGDHIASSEAKMGNINYIQYLQFRNEFRFPIDVSAGMLSDKTSDGRNMKLFRDGHFVVTHYEKARDRANKIMSLSRFESIHNKGVTRHSYFIRALILLMNRNDFDFGIFVRKLELQANALQRCANTRQYIEIIQNIYNHHTPTEKKVMFLSPL